jgi:hypothetical protein
MLVHWDGHEPGVRDIDTTAAELGSDAAVEIRGHRLHALVSAPPFVACGLRGSRHHPQLLQQAAGIHQDARGPDLVAFNPVNDHAPDPDHAVSRGNPEELALMRACPVKAGDDVVVLGDLLLDAPGHIRKGPSQAGQGLGEALTPGALPRAGPFRHHIRVEILAGDVDRAPGEHAVDKGSDAGLVVL